MRNNLNFKIIAIIVAIFIWLQITLISEHQSEVELDLRILNAGVADSLDNSRGKIKCLVEGSGMDLIKLRHSNAYIEMEARDIQAGNDQNFEPRDVPQNLKIAFMGVDPESAYKDASGADIQTDRGFPSAEMPAGKPADAGLQISSGRDNISSIVLPDIPIERPPGIRLFPPTATLKVQGRLSILKELPQGVSVRTSGKLDSRGMYKLEVSVPDGVILLDITPKQVRAGQ